MACWYHASHLTSTRQSPLGLKEVSGIYVCFVLGVDHLGGTYFGRLEQRFLFGEQPISLYFPLEQAPEPSQGIPEIVRKALQPFSERGPRAE